MAKDKSFLPMFALFLSLIASLLIGFVPTASASSSARTIPFEAAPATAARVVLGELAFRSQNGQLLKSGSSAPYKMTGTDSRGSAYEYFTDANYGNNHSNSSSPAQLRESDERPGTNGNSSLRSYSLSSSDVTDNAIGGTKKVVQLGSNGNIEGSPTLGGQGTSNLTFAGNPSFGSHFGPDIWTQAFTADVSQSVSYYWKAQGGGDDYEVYGYLVNLNLADNNCIGSTNKPTASSDYTVLSYGRGLTANWTTASSSIPQSGCFRFRFVGGTYDASGGLAVGATFSITEPVLGKAQTLNFPQPDDVIRTGSAMQITIDVTTNATSDAYPTGDVRLSVVSPNTSGCTVSGFIVTVTNAGSCSVRADGASIGDYGPSASVTRTFTILSSATKPVSSGGDSVSGTPQTCSVLTAQLGTWATGGAAITSTTYQWLRNGDPITGATNSTYTPTSADAGAAISFRVTRENSVGATSALSTSIIIVDTGLTGLSLSNSIGLTPSTSPFDPCVSAYTASSAVNSITVTSSWTDANSTVTVGGNSVLTGQASSAISLSPGSNTINVVVTNGAQSRTTTITVTYAAAPLAVILIPTDITIDTSPTYRATLNATVNPLSQTTSSITFQISKNSSFTGDTTTYAAATGDVTGDTVIYETTPSSVSGGSAVAVSADVTKLVASQLYYVRVIAVNASGTTTSNVITFVPGGPSAVTQAASSITNDTAVLNASVTPRGAASTDVFFELSESADMANPTLITDDVIAGGTNTATSTSENLTGLTIGATYYFRVKAVNDVGANFGNILSFTVTAKPTVTSTPPDVSGDAIGSSTARLTGTVNANGANVTTIIFLYGLTNDVSTMSSQATATPSVTTGNVSTDVQVNLSSLTPSTTYYYILRAVNSVGTSDTTVLSFSTTADAAPTAVLSGPASTALTDPFTITITFNEVVTGFASSDLTVTKTGGGAIGWTAQTAVNIANGGRIYTVEFRPNSPTATTLTVALDANKVLDLSSQANLAASSIQVIVGVAVSAPNISYSPAIVSSRVGDNFSAMTPTNTGGAATTWSVSPSLPGGLVLNTSTGIISGTPTTSQGQTVFTITATNAGGTSTTTITLTINVRRTGGGSTPVVPVVPVVPEPKENPDNSNQFTKAPVPSGSKPINGAVKTVGNKPGTTPVVNATPTTPIRVIQEVKDAVAQRVLIEPKNGEISFTPLNGWTGRMSVPIVKTINNQEVEVFVDVEVAPEKPSDGEHKLTTFRQTLIEWEKSPSQVVKYQVELNRRVVCEVTTTSCRVNATIGPNSQIKVTAIGNDDTKSEQVLPAYKPEKRVQAATVYFAENSAAITAAARRQLNAIANILQREGFQDLRLIGHTDGQGGASNAKSLSTRRAVAVQEYLLNRLGAQASKIQVAKTAVGEKKPVASNATKAGQAKNRRTELWLR